jgi:hypothetical protein
MKTGDHSFYKDYQPLKKADGVELREYSGKQEVSAEGWEWPGF